VRSGGASHWLGVEGGGEGEERGGSNLGKICLRLPSFLVSNRIETRRQERGSGEGWQARALPLVGLHGREKERRRGVGSARVVRPNFK
jgi:hypothetical protein